MKTPRRTSLRCLALSLLSVTVVVSCASRPIAPRQYIDDASLSVVDTITSQVFDDYVIKAQPDEDFSRYTQVMVTPVTLRLEESEWDRLTDYDRQYLFTNFQRAYRDVFDEVELTNSPDVDTLIVHTYITKLVPSDPARNFAPFIIGELDLGAAAFETAAFDNRGRLVATARGTYNGTPLLEGYTTWGVVCYAVTNWLANIKQLLRQGGIINKDG